MRFIKLFENYSQKSYSDTYNYWSERFKSSKDKPKVLGELLCSNENDSLDFLLDTGIINASDMALDDGKLIPAFQKAWNCLNFDGGELLASYSANLDYRIHLKKSRHPYGEVEMPLQHWLIMDMSSRMYTDNKLIYQIRRILGVELLEGDILPNSVDSWGMNPLLVFFSTMKWPDRDMDDDMIVRFVNSIVSMYVDAGIDINAEDKYGRTVVWWLFEKYPSRSETYNILKHLFKFGANIGDIKTTHVFKKGVNVIEYLDFMGRSDIAELLLSNGYDYSEIDMDSIKSQRIKDCLKSLGA